MNKKNTTILFLLIFVTVSGAAFLYSKIRVPKEKMAEQTIDWAAFGSEIEAADKNIRLSEALGEIEKTGPALTRARAAWEEAAVSFPSSPPAALAKTRDWPEKLSAMLEQIRRADELARENDFLSAGEEYRKYREIYSAIRVKNNIMDLSDDLLAMYLAGDKASRQATREAMAADLDELKQIFTEIKELAIDDRYEALMAELELTILDLGRLLPGPDWQKAKNRLEPLCRELYFAY